MYVPYYQKCDNQPIPAPLRTNHTELGRKRKSRRPAARARTTVSGSTSEAAPNRQVTTTMRTREETFTPSSRPLNQGEVRNLGMRGALMATKKNAGRKIPRVANNAPLTPPKI